MKFTRKSLAVILAVCMVICYSVTAFADEARASTVGTLTIFSSNDGGNSSWNTSGHAFISFKNTSSSSIKFGGLNVGAGHEITIGTWGNKSNHVGIWYNLESYFVNNQNTYSNRVSLSMDVTQANINTINNLISKNDTWTALNNCSSFAVEIWNAVSSKTLSSGIPNTPTSLMSSIKSKSGYETGRAIGSTTPIGYVSNGSFVSVTMATNAFNVNAMTNVISTMEGPAVFITPINMNPNSGGFYS